MGILVCAMLTWIFFTFYLYEYNNEEKKEVF